MNYFLSIVLDLDRENEMERETDLLKVNSELLVGTLGYILEKHRKY